MLRQISNPLLRPGSILLAGISLAIGWGIRGNYGHETGAMFPGALTAIAVCLLSGRDDWRKRVPQFALFGMLGWAFGGSMSYMQVIGFSQSGHAPTQWFGFAGLFFIGFLWAALGGMGTAIPAVMDQDRLNRIFNPLVSLLAIWVGLYVALHPIMWAVQAYLELDGMPGPMQRQELGLYWLDSDWFTVLFILGGTLLFDFDDRRWGHWQKFLVCAAAGAIAGLLVMFALVKLGWSGSIYNTLVQHQGVYGQRFTADQLAVTNWPPIILYFATQQKFLCTGDVLGVLLGMMVGIGFYFAKYGQFRDDSGLFLWMAVGWFVGFLALPVLGSLFLPDIGGLRMTPPRGDNWAGVLGTFLGASIYMIRHQLKAVVLAGIVCGIIGGIGFSGISLLQGVLLSYGNEAVSSDPAVQQKWTEWQKTEWQPTDWMDKSQKMPGPAFVHELRESRKAELEPWQHFHRQNWHSFLEQSYGFVNGLGVVFAMAILVTRIPRLDDNAAPRQPWTDIVSITFALPAMVYVNTFKNLQDWSRTVGGQQLMPDFMKAPWIDFEMSGAGWFNLFFALATAAFIALMIVHTRRPLAVVPASWLGRGQFLYFLLLWAFVLGNFSKALAYFSEGRLLTEGIIQINAVIATLMILLLPCDDEQVPLQTGARFGRWLLGATAVGLLIFATLPLVERAALRHVYGDAQVGHGGINFRFGPNASWKREPLLKGQKHR